MATRRELIEVVAARYRAANRNEKKAILDEFVAVTGFHRKHAIRVLKRSLRPAMSDGILIAIIGADPLSARMSSGLCPLCSSMGASMGISCSLSLAACVAVWPTINWSFGSTAARAL